MPSAEAVDALFDDPEFEFDEEPVLSLDVDPEDDELDDVDDDDEVAVPEVAVSGVVLPDSADVVPSAAVDALLVAAEVVTVAVLVALPVEVAAVPVALPDEVAELLVEPPVCPLPPLPAASPLPPPPHALRTTLPLSAVRQPRN